MHQASRDQSGKQPDLQKSNIKEKKDEHKFPYASVGNCNILFYFFSAGTIQITASKRGYG